MGTDTSVAPGEEVPRHPKQQVDRPRAFSALMEEGTIGLEEFAVCPKLWAQAEKRMKWRI